MALPFKGHVGGKVKSIGANYVNDGDDYFITEDRSSIYYQIATRHNAVVAADISIYAITFQTPQRLAVNSVRPLRVGRKERSDGSQR